MFKKNIHTLFWNNNWLQVRQSDLWVDLLFIDTLREEKNKKKMALQSVKGESINIESTSELSSSTVKVRCLVQQCLSAKLFTKVPEGDSPGEFVEVISYDKF